MANRKTEDNFHIQGFKRPSSNYFKMPVEWTDYTAKISSLAELKVVEYVLRHTWGYQEFGIAKRISNDEFMNGRKRKDGTRMDAGTGLSLHSVIDGLRLAIQHGFLVEEVDDTDKGRIKKYYRLSMVGEGDEEEVETGVQTLGPPLQNLHPRTAKSAPRTEKETIERNLKKENHSNFEGSTPTHKNGKKRNQEADELIESKTGDDRGDLPFSEDIAALMGDLSKQVLHDVEHIYSNQTQAMNLWRSSQLSEDDFLNLLREAKGITLKNTGNIRKKAGYAGLKNRAPYFFQVVKDLLGKKRQEQLDALRRASLAGHSF